MKNPLGISRFLVLVVYLLLSGCSDELKPQYALSGSTMGTSFHVKLVFEKPVSEERIRDFQTGIQAVLNGVDDLMSTYKNSSEISRLNQAERETPLQVSAQTLEVLVFAQTVSEQTDGAFDVTVGPLVDLWGFGSRKIVNVAPEQDAIDRALGQLGWQSLMIDAARSSVSKTKALKVDLSAIAKGYAVDQVASYLDGRNIANYMVEVGGELMVSGHNQKTEPWRLGIEQPDFGGQKAYNTISLQKGGLATSGDYRNYFEQNGQRYSHTIDPRTGYPVSHKLASVSVIADSCMEADALATALMVLGENDGYRFAAEHGYKAFFIYRDGDGFSSKTTPGFARYLN